MLFPIWYARAMWRLTLAATLALLMAASATAAAAPQTPAPLAVAAPDAVQELILRDGTRAFGRIERIEGTRVIFRTTAGAEIVVDAAAVVSARTVPGRLIGGEFRRADPNPTRLFFAPTGRAIPRGEGYVGVYEILLPFVQVGLTDRISMGFGTPLIFGQGSAHPFWITPKVQVLSIESMQAAVGVMHFLNVGDGNLGIAYAVVTRGSADTALTVGAGYAYDRSYDRSNGAPMLMVGAEHRVSRGLKLVTENYVFSGGGIASGGIRWIREHLAVDFAIVVPSDGDTLIAFPLVNVVWTFARPR